MHISKRLKELRIENNFSQEKLAEILNVSRQTISSLPKYLSNFPYFTGFPAHSLVK